MSRARLRRRDYATDAITLAQSLIGCRLVRILDDGHRLSGVIVETEAYLGAHDKAAHSYNARRTPRNEAMYAAPGTCYVYFTYGMHHCANVVCGQENDPTAVLLRALAPDEGIERMRRLRAATGRRRAPLRDTDLCSGPARLCQALDIDKRHNMLDLTRAGVLFIERMPRLASGAADLINTPRIGVAYAEEWGLAPLRWALRDCPHVTRARLPRPPDASYDHGRVGKSKPRAQGRR